MTAERATDKLARWVAKRESFTRREAFLGTKGGAMRTVEDFDTALASLLDQGAIALADEQPSRGAQYVTMRRNNFPASVPEQPSRVVVASPPLLQPSAVIIPIRPVVTAQRTAADVIANAAAKRRAGPANWAGIGCLEAIERRHGKMAGDTLRGNDLHPTELADLIRFGA